MKRVSDLIRIIIGMYDKRKSELNIISDVNIAEDLSVEVIINEGEHKK